jgi:hypothetical protein
VSGVKEVRGGLTLQVERQLPGLLGGCHPQPGLAYDSSCEGRLQLLYSTLTIPVRN